MKSGNVLSATRNPFRYLHLDSATDLSNLAAAERLDGNSSWNGATRRHADMAMINEQKPELDPTVIALGAVYAGAWVALVLWLALRI